MSAATLKLAIRHVRIVTAVSSDNATAVVYDAITAGFCWRLIAFLLFIFFSHGLSSWLLSILIQLDFNLMQKTLPQSIVYKVYYRCLRHLLKTAYSLRLNTPYTLKYLSFPIRSNKFKTPWPKMLTQRSLHSKNQDSDPDSNWRTRTANTSMTRGSPPFDPMLRISSQPVWHRLILKMTESRPLWGDIRFSLRSMQPPHVAVDAWKNGIKSKRGGRWLMMKSALWWSWWWDG